MLCSVSRVVAVCHAADLGRARVGSVQAQPLTVTVFPSAAATAIVNFVSSAANSFVDTPECLSTFVYAGINFPGDNGRDTVANRTWCNMIEAGNYSLATSSTECLDSTSRCSSTDDYGGSSCAAITSASLEPGRISSFTCSSSGTFTGGVVPIASGPYCTAGCWGRFYGQRTPYLYSQPAVTTAGPCNRYASGCQTSGLFIGVGGSQVPSMYPFFSYSFSVRPCR
jgi:hypothetical protein